MYPIDISIVFSINYSSSNSYNIGRLNKKKKKGEGYIPLLHIKDGVYVRDGVVKNHKGKAYLKFENTNKILIKLSVPIVNLEVFEEPECNKSIKNFNNFKQTNNEDLSSKILNNFLRKDNSLINSYKFYYVIDEDREECIK